MKTLCNYRYYISAMFLSPSICPSLFLTPSDHYLSKPIQPPLFSCLCSFASHYLFLFPFIYGTSLSLSHSASQHFSLSRSLLFALSPSLSLLAISCCPLIKCHIRLMATFVKLSRLSAGPIADSTCPQRVSVCEGICSASSSSSPSHSHSLWHTLQCACSG